MPKRCMPGVICIENATIAIIVIIIVCGMLLLNFYNKKSGTENTIREKIYVNNPLNIRNYSSENVGFFPKSNFGFSNAPNDVLLNPYQPPLRDDRYFPGRTGGDIRGELQIPINIPTQSHNNSSYRQVGILTRINGEEMILPLLGRPLFTNRDKWNFYTMSDKNNAIKLPISNKGKSCTSEYGCDNLYNGDSVYVEGYNDAFKVTVYDNQVMNYIPFL